MKAETEGEFLDEDPEGLRADIALDAKIARNAATFPPYRDGAVYDLRLTISSDSVTESSFNQSRLKRSVRERLERTAQEADETWEPPEYLD